MRGFTYKEENAPLDMRMDQRQSMTAKDILAEYSEQDLYRMIRDYGEDKFAKNIAKHIVQARQVAPSRRTGQLNEISPGTQSRQRYGRPEVIRRSYISGNSN